MNTNSCLKCGDPKKKHVRKNDNKYHCTVKGCDCVAKRNDFLASHDPYLPSPSPFQFLMPSFREFIPVSRSTSLSENVSLSTEESSTEDPQ